MVSAMTPSPKKQGTKEEWLNLPRRKCDNCGKWYKPTRPNSRFHSDECKFSFHRHGGAYAKLKAVISKEIERQMILTEICKSCKPRRKNQPRRPGCKNPDCRNGRQLTSYGKRVIQTLIEFAPPEVIATATMLPPERNPSVSDR